VPQTFQCPGGNWGQPLRCGEVLAQAEEPSGGPDLPAARLRVVRIPEIELRWWDGCPSTDRALAELQEILDSLDLSDVEVRMTEISNDAEARAIRFPGSPTILVDGQDVDAPGPEEPGGLTCRVYRRRDGRVLPTPDPDDVRDALRRGLALQEVGR